MVELPTPQGTAREQEVARAFLAALAGNRGEKFKTVDDMAEFYCDAIVDSICDDKDITPQELDITAEELDGGIRIAISWVDAVTGCFSEIGSRSHHSSGV